MNDNMLSYSKYLRDQWLLSVRGQPLFSGFTRIDLNDRFSLQYHQDSIVHSIEKERFRIFVIGICIDPFNRIEGLYAGSSVDDILEAFLYCAGSYNVIFIYEGNIYFFNDMAGLAPIYYSSTQASSIPGLIESSEFDTSVKELLKYPDTDWLPFPLTTYKNVKALAPNHLMSFPSADKRRFWPFDFDRGSEQQEDIVADIIRYTERVFEQLCKKGPLVISITGGRDSRVSLALTEHFNVSRNIDFFTIIGDSPVKHDVKIPKNMARKLDLPHKFLNEKLETEAIIDVYDFLCGSMSVGPRRDIVQYLMSYVSSDKLHINGHLSVFGSCYLWPSKEPPALTSDYCMDIVHSSDARIRAAFDEWLSSVKHLPREMQYDLLYVEQKAGRWGACGDQASKVFFRNFSFFNNRYYVEKMMGVPVSVKYKRKILNTWIIEEIAPHLADFPYEPSYGFLKRNLPKGVIKKLTAFKKKLHNVTAMLNR